MAKGPQSSPEARLYVLRHARRGPATISELHRRMVVIFGDKTPSIRTLRTWRNGFVPTEGEAWTMRGVSLDEAQVVIRAIQDFSLDPDFAFTVEEGHWFARVQMVAEDLHNDDVLAVSRLLMRAERKGQSAEPIYVFLAWHPWRSQLDKRDYKAWLDEGRLLSPPPELMTMLEDLSDEG